MYAAELYYVLQRALWQFGSCGLRLLPLFRQTISFPKGKDDVPALWVGIIATWTMSWPFWSGYGNLTGEVKVFDPTSA
jgi:hypothetical protein